jgi:hypothetical protein
LNALFCFLGANFLGPLVQAGLVLLERDPDNQIATNDLAAELCFARACLTVLGRNGNRHRKDCGKGDSILFQSWMRWVPHR